MSFLNIIQQNINTAVLFWISCIASIITSYFYQWLRVKHIDKSNRPITRVFRFFWIFLIVIFPSILIGFRHYSVGADTINYWIGFLRLDQSESFFDYFQSSEITRPLFSVFQYVIFKVSNGNPTFFLFSIVFSTLFILVKALDRWILDFSMPMGLFVYYSLFGMQLLNQSRQLLALSIFFMAVTYLLKDGKGKFYFTLLLASLVHYSAILGLIIPIIYYSKNRYSKMKKRLYYTVWAISPFIIYPVLNIMSRFMPSRYSIYFINLTLNDIGFGLILNLLPVFIPIIIFNKYLKDNNSQFLVRIAFLTLPLRLAGYYSYFLMRMYYYSAIFMIIIIPTILKKIKYRSNKVVVRLIIIFICIFYFVVYYMYVNNNVLFPYHSIYSNGF